MITEIIIADLWAILLLLAYVTLPKYFKTIPNLKANPFIYIVGISLVVRLIPNFILPMGALYDIESFQVVGKLVAKGEDVYSSPKAENRHPYLPAQMYWMAFSDKVARYLNTPYVKIVRIAPIMADVCIAVMLYLILKNQVTQSGALLGALLYSLNPIPVFVSAYHGQFDAIPTLLILLSIYFAANSAVLSGSWLGFAILLKSWPVLTLPSLVTFQRPWKRRWVFLITTLGIPLLGVLIYSFIFAANPLVIFTRALSYNRGIGVWGYTYFARLFATYTTWGGVIFGWFVSYGRYLTLIGIGLIWFVRARNEKLTPSILTILVSFFAISHVFAIQYLMWLIPFAILALDYVWLRRYTIAAFIYMIITYSTFIFNNSITKIMPLPQADLFIIMVLGLPIWVITIAWMVSRLRGLNGISNEYQQVI
jgi:hypothetical protein